MKDTEDIEREFDKYFYNLKINEDTLSIISHTEEEVILKKGYKTFRFQEDKESIKEIENKTRKFVKYRGNNMILNMDLDTISYSNESTMA